MKKAIIFPLDGENSYINACQLIGAITIVWNDAHEQVFKLFWYFSGMSKDQAEAVFFSLRADSSQRDITKSIIRKHPNHPEEHKAHAIKWITTLDKKSGERNAATHTMWDSKGFMEGKIIPSKEVSAEYLNRNLSDDNSSKFGKLLNSLHEVALELHKAAAIFEILKAESVEEVQRIGPEKFIERFGALPRYVELLDSHDSGIVSAPLKETPPLQLLSPEAKK